MCIWNHNHEARSRGKIHAVGRPHSFGLVAWGPSTISPPSDADLSKLNANMYPGSEHEAVTLGGCTYKRLDTTSRKGESVRWPGLVELRLVARCDAL